MEQVCAQAGIGVRTYWHATSGEDRCRGSAIKCFRASWISEAEHAEAVAVLDETGSPATLRRICRASWLRTQPPTLGRLVR